MAWSSVAASEVDAHSWRDHTQSVLELLMQDTQRALQAHAPRQPAAPPRAAPVVAQPKPAPVRDTIRLVELFGAGDQLTAVVQVNGQRKEYKPGASLPYAGGGRRVEYRLLRIVDTCVVLQKGKGAIRTACYEPQRAKPALSAVSVGSQVPAATALSAPLPYTRAP